MLDIIPGGSDAVWYHTATGQVEKKHQNDADKGYVESRLPHSDGEST